MQLSRSSLLVLIFLRLLGGAEPFSGPVVGISDGDTIRVMHDGVSERIRLNGIDCPELKQPFGSVSKRYVSDLAFGKVVTVRPLSKDRYGRTIADVVLPEGRVLNHEVVRAGLAWWFRRYAPRNDKLRELEAEARSQNRGLWKDVDPIPPWDWRKGIVASTTQ